MFHRHFFLYHRCIMGLPIYNVIAPFCGLRGLCALRRGLLRLAGGVSAGHAGVAPVPVRRLPACGLLPVDLPELSFQRAEGKLS